MTARLTLAAENARNRENYTILKGLYDGLARRLEYGGVAFPVALRDASEELRRAGELLKNAGKELYFLGFDADDTDHVLYQLAFAEKYFAPRHAIGFY